MLSLLRSFAEHHRRLAGALCLLLLLFGTTLQVTHSHPSHESHADCALCVTAHAAVDILILPSGFVAPIAHVERAPLRTLQPLSRLVLAHPLWNRPPPAPLPLA